MSWLSDTWNETVDKTQPVIEGATEQAKQGISTNIANWFSKQAEKYYNTPDGKEAVNNAAGQKLGVAIIENWKIIVGVIAGVTLLAIATRKKW